MGTGVSPDEPEVPDVPDVPDVPEAPEELFPEEPEVPPVLDALDVDVSSLFPPHAAIAVAPAKSIAARVRRPVRGARSAAVASPSLPMRAKQNGQALSLDRT